MFSYSGIRLTQKTLQGNGIRLEYGGSGVLYTGETGGFASNGDNVSIFENDVPYASSGNLFSTGQNLQTQINNLTASSGDSFITVTGSDIVSSPDFTGQGDISVRLNGSSIEISGRRFGSIEYVMDGAGSAVETGNKGYLEVPFNCILIASRLVADQTGIFIVDVKKSTYVDYPATSSICGSTLPTLDSGIKTIDILLSGWTTTINSGDLLQYMVNSGVNCQSATLSLNYVKF